MFQWDDKPRYRCWWEDTPERAEIVQDLEILWKNCSYDGWAAYHDSRSRAVIVDWED